MGGTLCRSMVANRAAGNVAVDRNYYPKFKDSIKELMHRETHEAVNDVFRNGASALNFLKADHVFVNQTLASYYRLKGSGAKNSRRSRWMKNLTGEAADSGDFFDRQFRRHEFTCHSAGVWLADVILHDPPPIRPQTCPRSMKTFPALKR